MQRILNITVLKQAMDQAGFNSAGLAKKLEVSREAVSKWLNGQSLPRPDKLLKLALLVGLKFDQIVVKAGGQTEPVVAFRKKGAHKTTVQHISHAKEMGWLLRPLASFLPFDQLIRPATLKQPCLDYGYVQKVAAKIREEVGVTPTEPIDFRHLIKKFGELQAVLIPVLWGAKERHENALHIFLPDSMTTWVYLNLDSEVHDFKFWMAHELGHILAPSLLEDKGEDFAEAFAGALLFPQLLAENAYQQVVAVKNKGTQMNLIKQIAEANIISPITVYYEMNHYAKQGNLPKIELGNAIYGAAKNLSKAYYSVSESLFDGKAPDAAHYIQVAETQFHSPIFKALKAYLVENDNGAGYVQAVLDVPLLDAKAIYETLA